MTTVADRSPIRSDDGNPTTTPKQHDGNQGKPLLVTLVLRRSHEAVATIHTRDVPALPQAQPNPLDSYAAAARQNAVQTAMTAVTKFVTSRGMTVVEADAARRSVVVSGTVAQMSAAFAVDRSLRELQPRRPGHHAWVPDCSRHVYHGGNGFSVNLPGELTDTVQGLLMDFEWIRRVRAQLRNQRRSAREACEPHTV